MDPTVRAMFDLGVILFASFLGAALFERMKLPSLIGMILCHLSSSESI